MKIEVETEEDGRFVAEVPAIPGAMAYGKTAKEAVAKVEALVLRVLADRIEAG
jgi:predicted RNase H-like HicB family nuclease